jgi:hypothetical protein
MTDGKRWKVGDYIHLDGHDHVCLIRSIEAIMNLDGNVELHMVGLDEHGTQAWLEKRGYTKLGPHKDWRVVREWDGNVEGFQHILVDPSGKVDSVFDHTDLGRSEAYGYADTYNLNPDRAGEFRQCPYCNSRCAWCA